MSIPLQGVLQLTVSLTGVIDTFVEGTPIVHDPGSPIGLLLLLTYP